MTGRVLRSATLIAVVFAVVGAGAVDGGGAGVAAGEAQPLTAYAVRSRKSWVCRGCIEGPLVTRYFFSRFQTLAVRSLPSLAVKSVGRSLPGAAKQNLTVSPSSS